jgi:hypothetical protein
MVTLEVSLGFTLGFSIGVILTATVGLNLTVRLMVTGAARGRSLAREPPLSGGSLHSTGFWLFGLEYLLCLP